MDSKYSQTVRAHTGELGPKVQRIYNAKKGEAARPPPSSSQAYGSVPSTGQRRPGLPRAGPAVLSARWGLASGFGTGPGVPPCSPCRDADRWAAPTVTVSGIAYTCPGGRMAHRKVTLGHPRARTAHEREVRGSRVVRFRESSAISGARLRLSPALHLRLSTR